MTWYAAAKHAPEPWWHHLDWGSLPAWLGSILSGASVLLAFCILLSDRATKDREEATGLLVWTEQNARLSLAKSPFFLIVHIFNGYEKPIPRAVLELKSARGKTYLTHQLRVPIAESTTLVDVNDAKPYATTPMIPPGKHFVFEIDLDHALHEPRRRVFIRDSRNRVWSRNLDTNRLRRHRNWWLKPRVVRI